jgi:hypothetical protein
VNDYLVYGVLGGVFAISMVAIMGGFALTRRERLLTHAERMKALDMGLAMPDDRATAQIKAAFGQPASSDDCEGGTLARKCYSTAIWVAFWGFGAATASVANGGHVGVALAISAAVGAVGVTSVICGTILASRSTAAPDRRSNSKPVVDADAYDFVGNRR